MRLLKLLTGLAGLGLLALSCNGTANSETKSEPTVSIPVSSVKFFAAGGQEEVAISVSGAKSITAAAYTDDTFSTESDWLSASYESPKVKLTAEANTTDKERTAYLRVSASSGSATAYASVKVVQAAGSGSGGEEPGPNPGGEEIEFEFQTWELEFGAEGGTQEVAFTTNAYYFYWNAYEEDMDTEADWISCEDGSDDYSVKVVVNKNTGKERYGYFVIFASMVDLDEDENEDAEYTYDYIEIYQAGASGNGGDDPDDPDNPSDGDTFEKVTSSSGLTDGWYLIVCEDESVAFDGSLSKLDDANNNISVSISGGKIAANSTLTASAFWYSASEKSLRSASGYYIGHSSGKNGLSASTSVQKLSSVSISGGDADIVAESGYYLRYNAAKDNGSRFRFYKSGQKAVQLYKLSGQAPKAPEFSVSTTVLSAGPKAKSASFSINASESVSWTAVSSNADFTLSKVNGSGNASITVSFSENSFTEPRSTTITVSTDNEEVETGSYAITLTQGPASEGDIDNGTPGYDDHLAPKRKFRRL